MTPENFCYWLQGRAELQPDNPPDAEEWAQIVEHLALVFTKVTSQPVSVLPEPIGPSEYEKLIETIKKHRKDSYTPPFVPDNVIFC